MAVVKFTSIDKAGRSATFDVDGQAVTRKIPEQFVGTIDEHLSALAKGLEIEFATVEKKAIETPKMKAGDVLSAVEAVK